jgi:hypothetical protein
MDRMVSKITLFEPHFDGAQIGPKTLKSGTPSETAPTRDSRAATSDSATLETGSKTGRMPRLRTLVGVGVFVSTLMAGLFAWRRFRGRGKSDEEDEQIDTATIEEHRSEATPTA